MKRLESQDSPSTAAAGLLFIGILLIGGLGLTLANQGITVDDSRSPAVTVEDITARQQAAIHARRATSGLLFNLAFGSLAALIGLRFSDKTAARLTGAVPVIAGGLLGLSLYAAHLLNSNIDYALTHGPIRLIGGHATEIPIAAQFWLFAIAILLLAWWALSTRIAAVSVIFAVAGGLGGTKLHAQHDPNASEGCVEQWSTAHGVRLTPAARASTVRLMIAVVARTKATIAPDQTCPFLSSTLDIIRREALDARISGADMPGWMERELKSLAHEIGTPNIAPGEFLEKILAAASVWRGESGLLAVRSRIGTVQVLATLQSTGRDWRYYTDCEIRVPTGTYVVRFVKDGKRAAVDRTVEVKADARVEVVVDQP